MINETGKQQFRAKKENRICGGRPSHRAPGPFAVDQPGARPDGLRGSGGTRAALISDRAIASGHSHRRRFARRAGRARIAEDHPVQGRTGLPVLMLSMHDESLYAERALRAGANGYIMKQEATERVLIAIRQILGGEVYVSDRMAQKMMHQFIRPAGSPGKRSGSGGSHRPGIRGFQADRARATAHARSPRNCISA